MITVGGRAHNMEEVREIAGLGYPFVEVSLDDPETVAAQTPRLLEIRREYGVDYLAHFPNEGDPFDVESLRERFMPRIKALLDLCGPIGASKATMHFWMDRRWAAEGIISRKLDMLEEIVGHASRLGVLLCIENLSERQDSFRRVFEALPALRMTLDIGHGELLSRDNTSYGFIEQCAGRIAHVHVHDNLGGTGVRDDLHLALGDGRVDYRSILKALIASGYDSTITMEVKVSDMPRTLEVLRPCIT